MDMIDENSKVKQLTAEVESLKSMLVAASDDSSAMREESLNLQAELDKVGACR